MLTHIDSGCLLQPCSRPDKPRCASANMLRVGFLRPRHR